MKSGPRNAGFVLLSFHRDMSGRGNRLERASLWDEVDTADTTFDGARHPGVNLIQNHKKNRRGDNFWKNYELSE